MCHGNADRPAESILAVFAVLLQKSRMIPICVDVTTVVWYNGKEIAASAENAQELQKQKTADHGYPLPKRGRIMGWMDEIKAEFVKTFIRDDRYKVFLTGFENTILITEEEPEILTLSHTEEDL